MFGTEKTRSTLMKLQRSLYGMKNASKIWFGLIARKLVDAGCLQMKNAPCFFMSNDRSVICYVDDLLVISKSQNNSDALKDKFSQDLIMKDLGNLASFLSI